MSLHVITEQQYEPSSQQTENKIYPSDKPKTQTYNSVDIL